jgi:ribA/ribD-fused uncharacterized protein
MSVNKNFANVFENMQQIVEDRQNGIRMTDSVIIFDDKLNPLSVGYQCDVELEGTVFTSADHALQYLRAMAFQDQAAMRQIAFAASAKQAKSIPIYRFNNNTWRKFEYRSMQVVIGAKVKQNKTVREHLKMTGTKKLVYASKHDVYFGCGLNMTDDNVLYPQFWSGQNQLGNILEQYRKVI